ncbi:ABC transporter permease [Kordiimonas pumila]|uniref:ABC transporter permease n=1 Tax=Kordiimonas pumila TaxID=2161677 RepID=A0ABV7D6S8_9PROT|nr:ABC transporter permease [Kordiimonas pumila]
MSLISTIKSQKKYRFSAIGLICIISLSIVGVLITPYDPLTLNVDARLLAPSATHPFGTDHFGRDLLSRMMVGIAVSLKVSFFTVLFATIVGALLGAVAGYFRGIPDRLISGITDAFLAMPGILLALALISVFGASTTGLVVALGIAYTPNVTRVIRGAVLSLRESEFVEAARLMGRSHLKIILLHILPNTIGAITVLTSSFFAQALLSESALSFLGLGVPPPYPSLGGILAESRRFMDMAPWLAVFPGVLIVCTLLCINWLGDAFRDHFDPRQN